MDSPKCLMLHSCGSWIYKIVPTTNKHDKRNKIKCTTRNLSLVPVLIKHDNGIDGLSVYSSVRIIIENGSLIESTVPETETQQQKSIFIGMSCITRSILNDNVTLAFCARETYSHQLGSSSSSHIISLSLIRIKQWVTLTFVQKDKIRIQCHISTISLFTRNANIVPYNLGALFQLAYSNFACMKGIDPWISIE